MRHLHAPRLNASMALALMLGAMIVMPRSVSAGLVTSSASLTEYGALFVANTSSTGVSHVTVDLSGSFSATVLPASAGTSSASLLYSVKTGDTSVPLYSTSVSSTTGTQSTTIPGGTSFTFDIAAGTTLELDSVESISTSVSTSVSDLAFGLASGSFSATLTNSASSAGTVAILDAQSPFYSLTVDGGPGAATVGYQDQNDGIAFGTKNGTFTIAPQSYGLNPGDPSLTLSYPGGTLSIATVPEPSSLILFGSGAAGLLGFNHLRGRGRRAPRN